MSPWYLLCVAMTVGGAMIITTGGGVASAVGGFMVGTGTYLAYFVGKMEVLRRD